MPNVWRTPFGMPVALLSGTGTAGTSILNSSTASVMWAYQSETTDSITRLAFRKNAGVGTSTFYRLSLQGLDSSGNPDGVIKSSGNAYVIFQGSSLPNATVNWLSLGASYTPSIAESLCNVLEYSSGTADGSNNITAATTFTSSTGHTAKYPLAKSGSSGVYSPVIGAALFGYGTASAAFGFPVLAQLTQNINSGATAEAAAKFTVLSGLQGTFKIKGVRLVMGTLIAAKSLAINVYAGGGASDTTVVQSGRTLDTDFLNVASAGGTTFYFPTPYPTLNLGDTYRIGISTSDASSQALFGLNVSNAADWESLAFGNNFTLSTRSGGNWTDTDTSRLLLELILDDVSPTVSSAAPGGGLGLIIQARQMIPY